MWSSTRGQYSKCLRFCFCYFRKSKCITKEPTRAFFNYLETDVVLECCQKNSIRNPVLEDFDGRQNSKEDYRVIQRYTSPEIRENSSYWSVMWRKVEREWEGQNRCFTGSWKGIKIKWQRQCNKSLMCLAQNPYCSTAEGKFHNVHIHANMPWKDMSKRRGIGMIKYDLKQGKIGIMQHM